MLNAIFKLFFVVVTLILLIAILLFLNNGKERSILEGLDYVEGYNIEGYGGFLRRNGKIDYSYLILKHGQIGEDKYFIGVESDMIEYRCENDSIQGFSYVIGKSKYLTVSAENDVYTYYSDWSELLNNTENDSRNNSMKENLKDANRKLDALKSRPNVNRKLPSNCEIVN